MKRGFTLIELLVVIAIIGILLSVVVALVNNGEPSKAYKICSEAGNHCYYVDSYTKEERGACVFLSEKEVRVCGNYIIEKIEKDED